MGQKECQPGLIPEAFREAMSSKVILRGLCRLEGYEDVEMEVDDLLQKSRMGPQIRRTLLRRQSSHMRSYELTETGLDGRKVTTRLERGIKRTDEVGRPYVIATQEHHAMIGGRIPRLEILAPTGEADERNIDLFFGTESIPRFFHAQYRRDGKLDWCSFIASPPLEKVFSKKGLGEEKEKEFICLVSGSQTNPWYVGIYIDTGIRTSHPVDSEELQEFAKVGPMNRVIKKDIKFPDHSLYLAVQNGQLTLHHTNERSLELDYLPHFTAGLPVAIKAAEVNRLFTSEGTYLFNICRNLPVYFSYPPLWMELDLKRTLLK